MKLYELFIETEHLAGDLKAQVHNASLDVLQGISIKEGCVFLHFDRPGDIACDTMMSLLRFICKNDSQLVIRAGKHKASMLEYFGNEDAPYWVIS